MPNIIGKLATTRQGAVYGPVTATAALTLSGYSSNIVGGARIEAELADSYSLYTFGYTGGPSQGFQGVYGGVYAIHILGGAQASATLTVPTLLTSGGSDGIARAELALSGYSLISSGGTDLLARAVLLHSGAYPLSARCGGEATNTGPRLRLVSSGATDLAARVQRNLPRLRLVATGTRDNIGSVVGVLPAMHVAGSMVIRGTLPRAYVTIIGTTGGAAEYEAYSFTILENKNGSYVAASHYTTFPFEQIVRYGETYYGVGSDGLFALGGDTFDDEPIVAVVETASTDFKSRELKRPFSLYMGGRVGADFRVAVVTAEVDTQTHTYRPVDKTGARNYRSLFGKGVRARYLAYRFTNTDGGDFELDDITPEVALLRRTA